MRERQNTIKWELLIGVIVAYIMVIGSSIYFFQRMSSHMEEVKMSTYHAQERLGILHSIEKQLLEIERLKNRYFTLDDQQSFEQIRSLTQSVYQSIQDLSHSLDAKVSVTAQIKAFQSTLAPITDLSAIAAQKHLDANNIKQDLLAEQKNINQHISLIREELLQIRNTQNDTIYASSSRTKNLAYLAIGLPLIFILYITNRVLKIHKELRLSKRLAEQSNAEYQEAQEKVNLSNWVLQEINYLNEKLNGVDDEKLIAKFSLASILKSLQFYAGAIYIQQHDSQTYQLVEHIGIDHPSALSSSFVDGEGLRGRATKTHEITVLTENTDTTLSSSSAIAANTVKQVILAPFIYENRCWGLLEIGGDFSQNNQLERANLYLQRITRTIAMSIKFGQSRTLVDSLLEETQQQTEELEAQQEELRITNEELTYKTQLLEASEEELRVQQEELQQANTELQEKAKLLEGKNEELTSAHHTVQQKVEEVQLASKYKSEFMANMSHELRTPLNSILILAKLLRDNKGKNLNEEQVKYASVIHSAGSDLLELINELLDLAKIESGKVELNYEQIQTTYFAKSLENLFTGIAQEKDITFCVSIEESTPKQFVSDEYRLEQILKNFLSNAFKFTDKKGTVNLFIKGDAEHLKFTVTDSGKGISPEKQSLIFEAFHQEDGSTSRKYGGTGLGLSISRETASLLGGNISLKSELGEGSSFTLTIPLPEKDTENNNTSVQRAQFDEKELTPKTSSPTAKKNTGNKEHIAGDKTLLIIEDDFNFADILKGFAMQYGFHVILAHDGADGIKKAKEEAPHAIILDVMLPLSDGWEVLRTLKADAQTKHIPIHMMSAANFDQRDFIEQGAIGFIAKPMSESSIKKALDNIHLHIKTGVKRVLLIEDQEFQSDIIKSAFAEQDINIIQAFTAHTGLEKLAEDQNIDCIILDIKLPDADGLEVLDAIKAMPSHRDTPIIINTAYDLNKAQIDRIHQHTKAMVLKSGKSNNRLIDEVTLFLDKLSSANYRPLQNIGKLEHLSDYQDHLKGKRILIADDDMRNVYALSTALQQYDVHIEIANNGIEALEIVNDPDTRVDMVLMDIMMPEMDGYEAIKKIRENRQNAQLPIIAITAKAMKGDREKSIQIGANDYISKPIDMDKLISLIRVWLSS